VRAKPFWDISHAKWVLDTFMKDLSHENDGLIFSPTADVRDNAGKDLYLLAFILSLFIRTALQAWKV
jgi:hypothetical protein